MDEQNWIDLKERLYGAVKAVQHMKNIESDMLESLQLIGKEAGINLAISYMQQAERMEIQ